MCWILLLKTYLKEIVFNGIIPFVAVYAGAKLSFKFQTKLAKAQIENVQFAECVRSQFALTILFNAIHSLRKHVEPFRNDELRFISLHPSPNEQKHLDISLNNLTHIIDFKYGGIMLQKLIEMQDNTNMVMNTWKLRNETHFEAQKASRQIGDGTLTMNPMHVKQLKDLTDEIFNNLENTYKKIEETIEKYNKFLPLACHDRKVKPIGRDPEAKK